MIKPNDPFKYSASSIIYVKEARLSEKREKRENREDREDREEREDREVQEMLEGDMKSTFAKRQTRVSIEREHNSTRKHKPRKKTERQSDPMILMRKDEILNGSPI